MYKQYELLKQQYIKSLIEQYDNDDNNDDKYNKNIFSYKVNYINYLSIGIYNKDNKKSIIEIINMNDFLKIILDIEFNNTTSDNKKLIRKMSNDEILELTSIHYRYKKNLVICYLEYEIELDKLLKYFHYTYELYEKNELILNADINTEIFDISFRKKSLSVYFNIDNEKLTNEEQMIFENDIKMKIRNDNKYNKLVEIRNKKNELHELLKKINTTEYFINFIKNNKTIQYGIKKINYHIYSKNFLDINKSIDYKKIYKYINNDTYYKLQSSCVFQSSCYCN